MEENKENDYNSENNEIEQSNNDKMIIDFLKETITKIENNTLSADERFEVTEFYLRYHYYHINTDDIDEDKMKKYLSLGWYIYKLLDK